jgi:thymidine kinase
MRYAELLKKSGHLEVICGSMFSGKTEELMRRLKRAEFAKQNVLTIKHEIDVRKNCACIVSHDGKERVAFSIGDQGDGIGLDKIWELADDRIDVVGIDEIQFFPNKIVDVIYQLIKKGKRVIVAGLDLDFRGEPFGVMPILLSLADEVIKLKAICVVCSKEAHFSQRLIDGIPAGYDDPLILVGAAEFYEPRCCDCFQIDKYPVFHKPHAHKEAIL